MNITVMGYLGDDENESGYPSQVRHSLIEMLLVPPLIHMSLNNARGLAYDPWHYVYLHIVFLLTGIANNITPTTRWQDSAY
jgi:hypothetical protein